VGVGIMDASSFIGMGIRDMARLAVDFGWYIRCVLDVNLELDCLLEVTLLNLWQKAGICCRTSLTHV
jgi:hypothetical protein